MSVKAERPNTASAAASQRIQCDFAGSAHLVGASCSPFKAQTRSTARCSMTDYALVGTFVRAEGSPFVGLGEETIKMMKVLAVTALSIGLATSAMAQSSSGGNSGSGGNNSGSGGNSSGTSSDTNSSGANSSGGMTNSGNGGKEMGSSNTNCGAPGGTQGAAQSEQNNGGSTNPGAGTAGTSC